MEETRRPEDIMPEEDEDFEPDFAESGEKAEEPQFATEADAKKMQDIKAQLLRISNALHEIAKSK